MTPNWFFFLNYAVVWFKLLNLFPTFPFWISIYPSLHKESKALLPLGKKAEYLIIFQELLFKLKEET